MIQRIQSLWLFLASMVSGILILMPSSAVLYEWGVPVLGQLAPRMNSLSATQFPPLLIIAAFMTVLPLIAIFFFKDRPRQRGLALLSILASLAFYVVLFMKITAIRNEVVSQSGQEYGVVGTVVPIAAIVFLILAIRGIRKDEKLLKSLDRLR